MPWDSGSKTTPKDKKAKRERYVPPRLKVYGKVGDLTRGGGGTSMEPGGGAPNTKVKSGGHH